jgi:hypothetical protein
MTGTPCSLSFGCKPFALVYELELSMMMMLTRSVFYATYSGEQETGRHFLLDCTAFAHERQTFWSQLEDALGVMEYADAEFVDPRLTLLHASPDERLQYLLGVIHPDWPAEAQEVIDATLRPFLISLLKQRTLLSATDEQPPLSDSDDDALDRDTAMRSWSRNMFLEPFWPG